MGKLLRKTALATIGLAETIREKFDRLAKKGSKHEKQYKQYTKRIAKQAEKLATKANIKKASKKAARKAISITKRGLNKISVRLQEKAKRKRKR